MSLMQRDFLAARVFSALMGLWRPAENRIMSRKDRSTRLLKRVFFLCKMYIFM